MTVGPPLATTGVGLHELIHVEFIQQCLEPARAQQVAADAAEAAEARRWLLGLR